MKEQALNIKVSRIINLFFVSAVSAFIVAGCDCDFSNRDLLFTQAVKTQMVAFLQAAQQLAQDCGAEHVTASTLPSALINDPGWAGWKGPYLTGRIRPDLFFDRWGGRVRFNRDGLKLQITSSGPDGIFGTKDDIMVETNLTSIP